MKIFQIFISQFVFFSLIAAGVYLVYRLVGFIRSRIPARSDGNSAEETWEGIDLPYRIPSSIFGFLVMDYVVISLVTTLIDEGFRDVFRLDFFTAFWGTFTHGMDSALGLIGCAGIFGATVFGIYEDYPPAHLKILGWVAVFSAIVGLGLRLR